ncbi:MAG: carbohydrate-binding protein [Verrucomicrobiota bacterium]
MKIHLQQALPPTVLLSLLLAFPALAEWELVWNDEFDGSGPLDQSKWNFETFEPGANNNELQKYTFNRPENCRRENGILILEGRRDWWFDSGNGNTYEYTSARIQTAGKFNIKYGKIEVRALMPWANGAWPAFWMMPQHGLYGGWPNSGEIDILEYVGWDNDIAHVNAHTQDHNFLLGTNYGWSGYIGNLENSYHTYAVEWWHDRINFFIDGVYRYGFDNEGTGPGQWPFNSEFFIILNHAIGGDWGGVMGIDTNAYDTTGDNYGVGYFIDYVRAYKWNWPDHDIPAHVEAEHYEGYNGDIREEKSTDLGEGWSVGYIDTGDFMKYTFNIPVTGWYQVDYRIASDGGGGVLTLGKDGTDIQQTPIPDTNGWQNWQTITDTVWLEAGTQTFDIYATAGGWNLNHFKIHNAAPATHYEAEYYESSFGVQAEQTSDNTGGLNLGFIDEGDYMTYLVDVPTAGTHQISYRLASLNGGGILTLGKDGNDIKQTPVPATGDWQNWQTITDTVVLEEGTQYLTLFATIGGWNINWWRLEPNLTDYETWEAHYQISGSGPTANNDSDNKNNAHEYFFGTNPTSSSHNPDRLPTAAFHSTSHNTYPQLTFTRRLNATNVTYTIETSQNLTHWDPCLHQDNANTAHTYTLLSESDDLGDGSQSVTLHYNQNLSQLPPGPFFFRIRAQEQP